MKYLHPRDMGQSKATHKTQRPVLSVVARWCETGGPERVEMTTLHGATPRSATLTLERQPEVGQLLCLVLPSTARRRDAGHKGAGNLIRLWALVWAVTLDAGRACADESQTRQHHVSVVFVGEEVPVIGEERRAGLYTYLAEEDGRFRLQLEAEGHAAPKANSRQRRDSRILLPFEVTVEVLCDDGSTATAREQTVTENVSRRGAAVWTTLEAEPGSLVRLICESQNVSLVSVVRARRMGRDGIERLHLEFIEGQWPLAPNV